MARTSEQGSKGLSLFLVEADRPGFQRGRNLDKIGLHGADTSELFFDDVRVPVANLLGQEGSGFAYLMRNLPQERLTIAIAAQAAAQRAFDEALAFVRERKAFGQRILDFQNSSFTLADMATQLAHLGPHELAEFDAGIAGFLPGGFGLAHARLREQYIGHAHRHAGHGFDPGGDHHILRARHHRLGGELDCLLRAAALPVDGDGGNALGQAGCQHGVAADMEALLPALADAAHDDIVDCRRIDIAAGGDRIQHGARHVGRVPACQLAATPPTCGADGLHDIGGGCSHLFDPLQYGPEPGHDRVCLGLNHLTN